MPGRLGPDDCARKRCPLVLFDEDCAGNAAHAREVGAAFRLRPWWPRRLGWRMTIPRQHGWRGWLWPLLLAGAIVGASGRSEMPAPWFPGADKGVHFLVFGLLATLVVRNGFAPRQVWVAVLAVSVFGATDEWHQSFTPGRSVEVADWVADTLGAAVAVAAYAAWPGYRRFLALGSKSRVEKSGALPPNRDAA
ncbi:MAG: hypothetical protein C0502_09455 [Opitutus sp.]|nr:hypothetical protein [Opitutus sp.]